MPGTARKRRRPTRGRRRKPGKKQVEGQPATSFAAQILEMVVKLPKPSDELLAAVEKACAAPNALTRAAAYRTRAALVRASDPKAPLPVEIFRQALADKSPLVRRAAVRLLSAETSADVALSILSAARADKDSGVRLAVMEAAATVKVNGGALAPIVAGGIRDSDATVAAAAAKAAPRCGTAVIAMSIASALNRPPGSDEQRTAALAALARAAGQLKVGAAAGALQLLATSKEAPVRAAAAEALGDIRNAASVDTLIKLLNDKNADVAGAAVTALSNIDSPRAMQALLKKLKSGKLPEEMQKALMRRVMRLATGSAAIRNFILTGPKLEQEQLNLFVEISKDASPAERVGFRTVAQRYLKKPKEKESDKQKGKKNQPVPSRTGNVPGLRGREGLPGGDLMAEGMRRMRGMAGEEEYYKPADSPRRSAALILANLKGDPAAEGMLLRALREDAKDIGEPAAMVLKRAKLTDRNQLNQYRNIYKELALSLDPKRAERYPGLAQAAPQENVMLCKAVVEAVGNSTAGDEIVCRSLLAISGYEKRPEMKRFIFSVVMKHPSAYRVARMADLYLEDELRLLTPYLDGIAEALASGGHLNPAKAKAALSRMAGSPRTPYRAAALARDALDTIKVRALTAR